MALSFSTNPITTNRSLKQFSDEVISSYIHDRHHDDDKIKIDVDNYISLIDSIITIADQMTVTIKQGNKGRMIFSSDFLNVNVVDPPVSILHQISIQLACKAPGVEKAHKKTLDILDILVNYSWESKAVLTFTAFTSDYGDIWHLNHYSSLDPLANSLAMIKGVPFLKKQLNSIKYHQVFLSPNSLIYSCLRAIKYMNQLKKLSNNNVKKHSGLSSALLRRIPLVSYWVIHIIVAARAEISSYLNETEDQPQQYLNELSEKIDSILNLLESYLDISGEELRQFSAMSQNSI